MSQQARQAKPTGKRVSRGLSVRARAALLLGVLAVTAAAEIIDRVVAVVGNQAITESEVWRQLALQTVIDGQPPVPSPGPVELRKATNRLIERLLVRREMAVADFPVRDETQMEAEIEELRGGRFWNGLDFAAALRAYGIEERDVREFLREKNSVLDFIDFRFKTGLQIPSEQIEAYYRDVYLPEFQRTNASAAPPLESVSDQIEEILREREIEPRVDEWLNELRVRARVAVLSQPAQPPMDAGE